MSQYHTSSFELKYTSKEEIIVFFCPSYNWTRNLFLPNTSCTHTITYFLILMLPPSLVIFSNSPTSTFTTDPTPIFVLIDFFIFIPYLIMKTDELMVDFGWGRLQLLQQRTARVWLICFLCEKSFQQKNTSKQKIAQVLRTNNSSLRKSYQASLSDLQPLVDQLQAHLSKNKNDLTHTHIYIYIYCFLNCYK